MAGNVTIPLSEPIFGPNKARYDSIVLREPTFDETLLYEEPVFVAMTEGGNFLEVQRPDVIRAYIDLCLVEPPDPALLAQGGMQAARKVRKAVLGFFREGEKAGEASKTSPTSSPSPGSDASGSTPSVD